MLLSSLNAAQAATLLTNKQVSYTGRTMPEFRPAAKALQKVAKNLSGND